MLLNILLLAISSSMDSLGIGITYGFKKIHLRKWDKLILFCISIFITFFSIFIGKFLGNIFDENIFKLIGSLILLVMGFFIVLKNDKNEYTFDLDDSKDIDYKEAILLGLALSLDSFCIGIGAYALGTNILIFSILVAFLQYLFLTIGNFLGIHLLNLKNIPQNLWTKISGIILILISISKL